MVLMVQDWGLADSHLPQDLLVARLLVRDGDLVVPVSVYNSDGLLANLDPTRHGVSEFSAAQEGPQFELHLRAVSSLLAVNANLPPELHCHRSHQNPLTMGVWHRHVVILIIN